VTDPGALRESQNAALRARFRPIPLPLPAEGQPRRRRARLVRFPVRFRATISSMPATRKLDQTALDRIVAGRAAGHSFRQIAAALDVEVDQSTVSRRVRSDPELRAAISAAQKRGARLARDRERKARAKARREAGVPRGLRPEQEQEPVGRGGVDGGPPLEERQAPGRPFRSGGVPEFASRDERLAYYEAHRLDDPPYSIWDSNAVRRGELPFAERQQQRRRR
jgi:hypothetical protein